MKEIKKGDNVTRKSYNNDIVFEVAKIIKVSNNLKIAILKGIDIRIEADARLEDLIIVDKKSKKENRMNFENKIQRITYEERFNEIIRKGKILHLDGDKKYANKSIIYYKKIGLNAVVKNIPENKQAKIIKQLLILYNPDILVITGHDGMIKNGELNNIFNYRNSRHFIETVKQAREFEKVSKKKLVIFAGACQSYFEALISAGANFASSPARILIDFLDPLIVAEKVATTSEYKYINIEDIVKELRDGKKGVGGVGSNGRMKYIVI